MSERLKIVLALFVSALTPALCFAVYSLQHDGSGALFAISVFSLVVFLINLAHAVLLGLPYLYVLKYFNLVNFWTSIIGGFLVGILPISLWLASEFHHVATTYSLVCHPTAHGCEMVDEVTHGPVTLAGCLGLLIRNTRCGVYGAIGGLAAWAVWRFVPSKAK